MLFFEGRHAGHRDHCLQDSELVLYVTAALTIPAKAPAGMATFGGIGWTVQPIEYLVGCENEYKHVTLIRDETTVIFGRK